MWQTMESRLNQLVKRLLDVVFYAGVVLWLAMPVCLKYLLRAYEALAQNGPEPGHTAVQGAYVPVLLSIMPAGLLALLIIRELRKMMQTVIRNDCFVDANVVSLRNMGTYAFIIAAIMFVRVFFFFTLTALTVSTVFVFAGLLSNVLAAVFRTAVAYKKENDLTI